MGWLKKAFKKVGNFIGDVSKTVAYVAVAPINSVTGHNYNPSYRTKAGHALGVLGETGVDGIHTAGKTFADTISGGYATKLANVVRKDENKETRFQYNENTRNDETGLLGKFHSATTKIGGAVGKLYGDKALASAGIKVPGDSSEDDGFRLVSSEPYEDPSEQKDYTMWVIIGIVLYILLRK